MNIEYKSQGQVSAPTWSVMKTRSLVVDREVPK